MTTPQTNGVARPDPDAVREFNDLLAAGQRVKDQIIAANGGLPPSDPRFQQFQGMVENAYLFRNDAVRQLLDPRRDIDDECGYPQSETGFGVGWINPEMYRLLYEREAVANRVVEVFPKEGWQVTPAVYESEDTDELTDFERDLDELHKSLRAEQSWFADDEGSPLWEHLKRATILAGIGHFGVILLGLDDGLNLDVPAVGVSVVPGESPVYGQPPQPATPHGPGAYFGNQPTTSAARQLQALCANSRPGPLNTKRPVFERNSKTGLPEAKPSRWEQCNDLRTTSAEMTQVLRNAAYTPPKGGDGEEDESERRTQTTGSAVKDSQPGEAGSAYARIGTDAQYTGIQLGPSEFPAEEPNKEKVKLLFVRTFDESLVQVVQYEANIRNPRFGQPVMYRITLNDPREQHSGIGLPTATVRVHWSRIIHIPGRQRRSGEIFSAPDMRPVLNRILDLRKIYSGDAEGFWRSGCCPLMTFETHPQLGGDVAINQGAFRDTMEQVMNGLQRWMTLTGMSAKTVSPAVADPTAHIAIQVEAICVQLGCPVRVFKGSERGELASSQDDDAWLDRVREYENGYITPVVIVPFFDRLIALGVLSEPRGYSVRWPDLEALSQKDKAAIATQVVTAITTFVSQQGESALPLQYLYTEILDWDQDLVDEILDELKSAHEEGSDDTFTMPPAQGPGGVTKPPAPPVIVAPGGAGQFGGGKFAGAGSAAAPGNPGGGVDDGDGGGNRGGVPKAPDAEE